jgi:hypothetical protein
MARRKKVKVMKLNQKGLFDYSNNDELNSLNERRTVL